MPLLVYRPKPFEHTEENKQFRAMCIELQHRIHSADARGKRELCLFAGNFNFNEKDFDAFLIKKNGILLIEFKNYGGKIKITNQEWTCEYDGHTCKVAGGSGGKTPMEQARNNRNAFKRGLVDSMAFTAEQADKVASVVVFNHESEIDNRLRLNLSTWLQVCDNTRFFGIVEDIVSQDLNMSVKDMKNLAERIVLDDEYIFEEYSDMDFLEIWNDPDELESYSNELEGVISFPEEPSPFAAAQNDEIDVNPEQNPELTVSPVEPPELSSGAKETSEEPSNTDDAVPCDHLNMIVANHISILQQLAMDGAPFCVYDCTESCPTVGFDISERYLVKVMVDPSPENAKILGGFLRSKTIYQGKDCLYWMIGEQIETIRAKQVNEKEIEEGLSFRRANTILAPWLDSFIFNHLEASYDPRYQRFDYNDNLGEEEAKIYLGTYFPRSYAENFLIFENLLMNPKYRSRIESKRKLIVFSVGAGTGGDIIGLLTAIDKYLTPNIAVSVIALDANSNSLSLLDKVIDRYRSFTQRKIEFNMFNERIEGEETLHKYAEGAFPDKSIDFLLFSKVGCELHGKGIFRGKNVYKVMLEYFMPKISETGVFSLLDVTTKVDGEAFMPFLMNQGVNSFVSSHQEFATLIPQSCCAYEKECALPCFFQQEFHVTHCKKVNDLSKICYRMVAHRELCDAVLKPKGKRFIVTPSKIGVAPDAFCQHSMSNTDERDAFNVNN